MVNVALAAAEPYVARLGAALRPLIPYFIVFAVGFGGAELYEHRGKTPLPFSLVIGQGLGQQLRDLKAAAAAAVLTAQKHVDRIETAQTAATTAVVTAAAQAQAVIQTRTVYLTKETPIYVTAAADRSCPVPVGFVSLWDAASAGQSPLPDPAPGTADAPSSVKLSGISDAHNEDAGAYWACRSRVDSLISLWDKQAAAFKTK